jgi:hypothetical protein
MSDPFWYHHDVGAVYPIGGAFADLVIRKYGAPKFVELYLACRPGTFADACRRVLCADVDTLEREFWADVEDADAAIHGRKPPAKPAKPAQSSARSAERLSGSRGPRA